MNEREWPSHLYALDFSRGIAAPLCQDTCPLSNLSIQTKAGGGK